MMIIRNLIKLNRSNLRSITFTTTSIDCKDPIKCEPILSSFYLIENFICEQEERSLLDQVEKLLRRRRYEDSHFDYAIKQYKEIEFRDWNESNLKVINRIKELGFSSQLGSSSLKSDSKFCELKSNLSNNLHSNSQSSKELKEKDAIIKHLTDDKCTIATDRIDHLTVPNVQNSTDSLANDKKNVFQIIPEVHILDLRADGFIKPHVDAVRFCGSRIIGLSLCSDAVMRLANTEDSEMIVDVLLKRRSLYMMIDFSRYNCTHEILGDEESFYRNEKVPRDRRVSIICRCRPDPNVEEKFSLSKV